MGEYNEGKGVNTPRYDENQMTPIKWNGSSWVKTAGNDQIGMITQKRNGQMQ